MVREAGAKLLALINEVLDLATALVTPSEPVYEDADAIVLVEEVRGELEEQSGMRPVHVRVHGALEQLDACIERRLLLRVLRTLGAVALDVTSAGEIALSASATRSGMLQLRLRADGFAGQATEDLARFVPASVAHERARRLLAMRLAIAQRLVETHPGALSGEPDGSLLIEVPAQPAPVLTDDAQAESDVAMALSYMAAMGHDLRTPLNAILGLRICCRGHAAPALVGVAAAQLGDRARARGRSGSVDRRDDRLGEARGRRAGAEAQHHAAAAAGGKSARCRASSARARAACASRSSADPDIGSLRVDGARLVQALVGLLDHAIRSNPGPSVSLRVQRVPVGVRIEISTRGSRFAPRITRRCSTPFALRTRPPASASPAYSSARRWLEA